MGFMQLEKIINEAIIEWKTGQDFNIDVAVRVSIHKYTYTVEIDLLISPIHYYTGCM